MRSKKINKQTKQNKTALSLKTRKHYKSQSMKDIVQIQYNLDQIQRRYQEQKHISVKLW